jgi:hypothetical protein
MSGRPVRKARGPDRGHLGRLTAADAANTQWEPVAAAVRQIGTT